MVWEKLPSLFDEQLGVETSAGITQKFEVEGLSALAPDEIPSGFHAWAEKRRREYRCGRHHARHALRLAGGAPVPILRDDEGVPVFPHGYSGSITHTGKDYTLAAAAITQSPHRLGIDAEELRDLPEDMIEYILSESERKLLREDLRESPALLAKEGRLALVAFSAKEAFYKCVFPRLRCRLSFHDVEIRMATQPKDAQPGEFVVRMLRHDIPEAPEHLPGRFVHNDQYVICGVAW